MISMLGFSVGSFMALASTDWSQPPVGCIEEVIYSEPAYACLDLSQVADPMSDFPAGMSAEDVALWTSERARGLSVCRAHEVVRRDNEHPGSQKAGALELSWMRVLSLNNTSEKIDSIYQASEKTGMPPQILLGALTQESLMADLGLAADGGNFSCGIGQLNIQEWCRFAQTASRTRQLLMGWPRAQIQAYVASHPDAEICADPLLVPELAKPFYDIGVSRLAGLPSYRLSPEHLKGIEFDDVVGGFPAGVDADATDDLQHLRFAMVQSFLESCSDYRFGIPAKAHELERIFHTWVPKALREMQTYPQGEGFGRSCRAESARVYPLHTGWLLADAIYNAGPGIVSSLEYYLRLDPVSSLSPETWQDFMPTDLISGLYWAGKYNPQTNLIDSFDFDGNKHSRPWIKSCIVQRHIARVIQHVTLPGYLLADTLEDSSGCSRNVPTARKASSGRISEF